MIQLIASDMDGTLVNNQHKISEANASAVKKAQEQGIEFIITTGRSYEDSYPQVVAAGIDCNYLVMNGSELRDSQGDIIQNLYLDNELVKILIEELTQLGLCVELYTTGGTFSPSDEEARKRAVATKINNFHPEVSLEEAYQLAEEHFLLKQMNVIDSVESIFEKKYKIGKIISFSSDKEVLAKLRESLAIKYPVSVTGSFAVNLEITNPLADKGQAIKKYATEKGIPLSNIMTIGDSFNDLTMMEDSFGYSVAMGNAIPEIKAKAKYVTDTNDEDGVAKAIERFLSIK